MGGFQEDLGLADGVLTGGGVQHQQGLMGSVGDFLPDHPVDLVQFLHQVGLVVEPSGGIHKEHVAFRAMAAFTPS